ncbi:M50 family metallopeptidase [Virgibacillus pantothenticus]|uniref:M50 family metallopeptidase n=1 Tax=Virgibacillus pantothenticus TaxID=1473 RepID=UPI001BAE7C6D|nr:site-2 protease family protein [Virgibacillus pantothenticus]
MNKKSVAECLSRRKRMFTFSRKPAVIVFFLLQTAGDGPQLNEALLYAEVEMMHAFLLFYLIVFVAPISILCHEFGHAVAAWFFRAEKVYISIGAGTVKKIINVGRFHFTIAPLFFAGGMATSVRQPDYTRREKLLITAAGPLFSSLIAIMFWGISQIASSFFIHLFMWFNLWIAFVNLIPFQWNEKQTDGRIILQLLLNSNIKK